MPAGMSHKSQLAVLKSAVRSRTATIEGLGAAATGWTGTNRWQWRPWWTAERPGFRIPRARRSGSARHWFSGRVWAMLRNRRPEGASGSRKRPGPVRRCPGMARCCSSPRKRCFEPLVGPVRECSVEDRCVPAGRGHFPAGVARLRKVPAMESLLEYWMDP